MALEEETEQALGRIGMGKRRKAFRKWLHKMGIVRQHVTYGLNGLDRKLEQYVDYDGGYYVELGANDGITQSNSYYFEVERGWRGLLVEPTPHKFLKCCEVRSQRNAIYCNACVGFDYKDKYVDMTYANLMTVANGLETDIGDLDLHINAAKMHMSATERVFRFGAVPTTLTELLEDCGAPNTIDFMSLDVEGAEMEVLNGVDFSKFSFKYILVECRSVEKMEKFLDAQGYVLRDKLSHHDYLFANSRQ